MQHQVLPFSLKASKFILSRTGKIFPGITARLFFRLYCTPPKRKFKSHHLAMLGEAKTGSLRVTAYPFSEKTVRVATYRWGASDKKILLLHGWGGRTLDFKRTIDALVEGGFEVVAFDAPAHGMSEGRRTTLVQWMHVLDQFLKHTPDVQAIVGHSMGGLMAALALARKSVAVPKLVMIATSVSAPDFFNDTYELFGIDKKVQERVAQLIRERLKDDLNNLDLYRYIGKIKADDILFVYDRNDLLVPYGEVERFLQEYVAIEPFRIEGEGHFRIMKDERVLDKITEFIGEYQTQDQAE